MAYLKNVNTGEVYPMNENLLRRGDFVAVDDIDSPLPAPEFEELKIDSAKPEKKPAAKPRKPKAAKAAPAPEPASEAAELDVGIDLDLDLSGLEGDS